MRQSGISTIISTILLVVITISLTGTAYLFVFGGLTSRISSVFSIIDAYEDMITVRNDGTAAITSFNVINLDDKPIDYLIVSNDPSLVGYWKFDDGIGSNTVDNSGKGNNGVFNGENFNDGTIFEATRINGKYGMGLQFDGINDYVNVPANTQFDSGEQTVELWFYVNDLSTRGQGLIGKDISGGNNWILYRNSGDSAGSLYWLIYYTNTIGDTSYVITDISPPLSVWTHTAFVFNSTGYWKSYRNGTLLNSGQAASFSSWKKTTTALRTGSISGYVFAGNVDEVRIYNRSLSQEEIQADMQSSTSIARTVASYSFEESYQYANDTHIWVKGKYVEALNFDGIDDYVNVSDNPSLRLTVFTIEMWLKSNLDVGSKTSQAIGMPAESYGDNYVFSWGHSDPNYQKSWAFRDTMGSWHGCIYKTALQKDVWYHLVTTYDGNILKIYLNGNLDNSTQLSGITPETTSLGNLHMSRSNVPFNGTIDEVRIYNRALSAEEIKAEYNMGGIIKPGQSATIKLYPSTPLSKGFHKITICTSNMCNTGNINIV